MWLVGIGIGLALLGGMLSRAGTISGTEGIGQMGIAAVGLGGFLFGVGILVEFFGIGTAVRKIASKT